MFGIHGAGILPVSRLGGSLGPYIYNFDLNDVTFTENMAVRTGFGGFDAAPIYQGKWDGTGTPDVVTFPRGTLLGNQTQHFYSNFDPYQGTVSFWIRPEWAGNDGIEHNILYISSDYQVLKTTGDLLQLTAGGQSMTIDVSAWTAGTAYCIQLSWDTRNTIDGTNYGRIASQGSETYGASTQPTASAPDATIYVGCETGPALAADAQISGLFVWRRVLFDGTYGVGATFDESGLVDEINAIYAAGVGADPAQIVGGSWDATFCLPTDQTEGALQTTNQAWSHPATTLIDVPYLDDGGLPGTDYAVEFNGTNTVIDCGSGATLDDIASGGEINIDIWFKSDGAGDGALEALCNKYTGGVGGFYVQFNPSTDTLFSFVICATTNASASAVAASFDLDSFADGKYHLVSFHYEDTTKWISLAVDGRWASAYATHTQGVGGYSTDAAQNFRMGTTTQAVVYPLSGAIAWCEISDNDRHSAGTDFIPNRAPYSDGNTVEYWAMDEGTGATAAASVTSPANDGTITNGSWSAIWAIVGTPEIPQSLQFYQENDGIDFGSGANIDDLFGADCTMECWARTGKDMDGAAYLISKRNSGAVTNGWDVVIQSNGEPLVRAQHATNDLVLTIAQDMRDGRFHHYAVDWDFGTLTGRLFVDGILRDTDTAIGAYQADAAYDCIVNGAASVGDSDEFLTIGWLALSDMRRYTGNSFIPAARNNPPANDANYHLLVYMDDGAGTTATDSSGNGYNGTITFGASTRWNNTPDLLIDESGAMFYQQGYNVGSDGADDGIYIPVTLTASTDYVIRAPLNYSPNAWPRITLYDVTAAGSIVDFDAPPMTAVHDGAGNAAAFTSTGEVYPASLIGGKIYNVTDGSSGTITAVGGTNQDTITAALAGGTDNDWDVADQAYIVPPDGWVFNEPIVARTSANTAYQVIISNRNADGIITAHQAEVLESLLDNGDHESLNGGFPGAAELITGWTNSNLDAGDTEPEATYIHAGAQSLEWNVGAIVNERMYYNVGAASGAYYTYGVWYCGDGTANLLVIPASLGQAVLHNNLGTDGTMNGPTVSTWKHVCGAYRSLGVTQNMMLAATTGAVGDRFSDDAYAFECDDVTLAVTPASQANSLEGTGIRVDGRDSSTVPATAHKVLATSGGVRFRATPRHSIANSEAFGQTQEMLFSLTEDANNYILLYRDDAAGGTLTLEVDQAGAGPWTDTDTPAWAADTEASIDVINYGGLIRVLFDGAPLLEIGGLTGFAADFTAAAYFGSDATPEYEFDGVISPP